MKLNSTSVRGCTDNRALVNKAIDFKGPPEFLCSKCSFFSSERYIKRFIIRSYFTSTINHLGFASLDFGS